MSRVSREVTVEEIEAHLRALGGGNHSDNMAQVRAHAFHYLLELTAEELLSVVFLQTDSLAELAPRGRDRRLGAVAARATALGSRRLGPNWDLGEIRARHAAVAGPLPALLLRDARGSESDHGGTWYLQDGCHRALGQAIAILEGAPPCPQGAYAATNRHLA